MGRGILLWMLMSGASDFGALQQALGGRGGKVLP